MPPLALSPRLRALLLSPARLVRRHPAFAVLLVAGGHASPLSWVLWSIVASCVAAAVAIAWRGRARVEPPAPTSSVRGPLGYAGPGSLGGVESTLRR